MNPNELMSLCPEPEWQLADVAKPYPLHCRVGEAVTTVTEDQSNGLSTYTVNWADGNRQFAIRHIKQPAMARCHAELRARMLFFKMARKSKAREKT